MPRFAANLSMLYNEAEFLDRFALAAADGFKGVEYLFPYAFEPSEIADRLAANGLTQVLFNLPPGDWDAGERGMSIFPDRVPEFRDTVALAIDYARATGCPRLHCMAGIPSPDMSRGELARTYIHNLGYAAKETAKAGIKLLIEPINSRDMPGYFLSSSAQAMEIIEGVGSDNVYLQYDIYHMQIMQGDLIPNFLKLKNRIAHVQIADTPGRHEPGTGEINYPFVFKAIDESGYDGWIGCEYRPKAGTSAGLGWAQRWLGPSGL